MAAMGPQDVSLRELLSFVFKYRRRLTLAFAVPFVAALLLSFMPTPRYQATGVLVVRLGSEYVYQPEIGNNQNGPSVNIPFERDQIFKSEVAILGSDDLHTQVIEAMGLDKLYPQLSRPGVIASVVGPLKGFLSGILAPLGVGAAPPSEEELRRRRLAVATALFDQRLDILLEKESAVIDVSFEHPDPALAVQTLNELLKLYFEKRRQLYLESRVTLAQVQVQAARDRVTKTEEGVEAFKRDHRIYSFSDQRAALLQQRTDIERQMGTLDSRQAELKTLLETLGRGGKGDIVLYDRGGGDAAMTNARIRLIDAESRLKDALAHYTKDSPVVAEAQKQVRDARDVLSQSELDRGRAESEMGSNDARRASLRQTIADYNGQLDRLDALERDFNGLVREAKLAEDDYTLYTHQLDEARAFDLLQRDRAGSVRVIQQPATAPNPKNLRPIIILAGFFVALIMLVLVAAVTEFLRSGFYTPEHLERSLGLPVLATIPYGD